MVVFTFTAQVLDMLLIKTTSYTLDVTLSILGWSGKKLFSMIFTPTSTEEDKLRLQLQTLTSEVKLLKETANHESFILIEK